MTEEQETRCHQIIHTHAVAAAAGNIVPIPGLGVAADIVIVNMLYFSYKAVSRRQYRQYGKAS